MKIANLRNPTTKLVGRGRTPGVAKAARNGKGTARAKNKGRAPATKAANKSTALARRPNGVSPATAQKFMQQGAALERAKLRANGTVTQANKRRGGKKARRGKGRGRRNPAGGNAITRLWGTLRNPSRLDVMETVKAAAAGVGGAAVSRVGAGVVLGGLDRFAPEYANMKYAPPALTALFGIFGLPMLMKYVGLNDKKMQDNATTGAVLFAAGEAVNLAAGGDKAGEFMQRAREAVGGTAAGGGDGDNSEELGRLAAARMAAARGRTLQFRNSPRGGGGSFTRAYLDQLAVANARGR